MLLPPSEGKAEGGRGSWRPGQGRFANIAAQRLEVAEALMAAVSTANGPARSKLFGVGGRHLERAVASTEALLSSPVLAASQRYTGVVHGHLDLDNIGLAAVRRASDSVVVLSGLMGLVGPEDEVPDYRCKMSLKLKGLGNVAAFWKPHISEILGPLASDGLVVDLLPAEHRKAIDDVVFERGAVSVRFETEKVVDGVVKRRIVGHDAKAAKGLLARHLLQATSPTKALNSFSELGWQLDPDSDLQISRGRASGMAVYVNRTGS